MCALPKPPAPEEFPQELQDYMATDELDPRLVPEDLRDLIAWAEFWSIGDDVARGEVMNRFAVEDLKGFVDAVWPRRERINAWYREGMKARKVGAEPLGFMYLSQALYEARGTVYPQPLPPPPPLTGEQGAQRDAMLRSLMETLKGGPEALLKMGGSGVPLEELDPEMQQLTKDLANHLSRVGTDFEQGKDLPAPLPTPAQREAALRSLQNVQQAMFGPRKREALLNELKKSLRRLKKSDDTRRGPDDKIQES